MKICPSIDEFPQSGNAVVLAIGSFDGVHLGHQAVIRAARGKAAQYEGEAWVMTFHPHPRAVIRPDQAPVLLSPGNQQIELLQSMGLDGLIRQPFDADFAALDPEAFFKLLVDSIPKLTVILVGENFRFGQYAAGDIERLKALAVEHGGIEIFITEEVADADTAVSSTRIRAAVRAGDLREAEALLGRHYAISGKVIDGRKVGREMGFPTANVASENGLLPPPGIYAFRVRIDEVQYNAAGYLAADAPDIVEAHLLDFDENIYGKVVTVHMVERVRDHIDFADREALMAQIAADVERVREILG